MKSRTGAIVPWACPDCSGTLWEEKDGPLLRFECRVGHAYSPESLLEEHAATVERTMWAAIRLLEEGAAAADYLRDHSGGNAEMTRRFQEAAGRHRENAAAIREVIAAL